VKLDSGIEGLIHNSTLMQEQGQKAEDFYKVDQEADFRVINISQEEQKIGLSSLLSQSASDEARQGRRRTTSSMQQQKETKYAQKQQQQPRMKGSLQMALESMNKDDDEQ
jgi:predicted RNA-binding protein with RPS1 domain